MQQQRGPGIDFREIFGSFDFRLLQQYLHETDMPPWSPHVSCWDNNRSCVSGVGGAPFDPMRTCVRPLHPHREQRSFCPGVRGETCRARSMSLQLSALRLVARWAWREPLLRNKTCRPYYGRSTAPGLCLPASFSALNTFVT